MEFSRKENFLFILFAVWIFLLGSFFIFDKNTFSPDAMHMAATKNTAGIKEVSLPADVLAPGVMASTNFAQPLANPPSVIRGIYVTSWSAASKGYLAYLDQVFNTTQINTVVVDLKDNAGIISYETSAPRAKEYKNFRRLFDVDSLIKRFHDRGIYVIARLNVFNDSALAKARPDLAIYQKFQAQDSSRLLLWQDTSGLYWLDPASQDVLDYNVEIAKDALRHGFDEINFDYIRFPSDGKLKEIGYPAWDTKLPRHLIMADFFSKLRKALPDAKISADFFGQTTTTWGDMGIGQILEDGFASFDYISPMVYPSHYINGFLGYDNPSEYPYEIIKTSLESALARQSLYAKENQEKKIAKLRPWIQDFDLGADYDAVKVSSEIKATQDALGEHFNGFLLWNPLNIYTLEALRVAP